MMAVSLSARPALPERAMDAEYVVGQKGGKKKS